MKRLFLIFLMCYTFSYSNYLISNSEIVLFYDKTTNNIHYIKGDIFQPVNISKIEGKIILDGDKILSLKDYPVEAKIVPETNILQLFFIFREMAHSKAMWTTNYRSEYPLQIIFLWNHPGRKLKSLM